MSRVLPDVVAGREDVDAGVEQLLRRVRIDALPAGDVLAVGDDEVDRLLAPQRAEPRRRHAAPTGRRRRRGRAHPYRTVSDRDAGHRMVSCAMLAGPRLADHGHLDLPGIGHLAARSCAPRRAPAATAWSSLMRAGSTMMRISRPACTANDFSTPSKELLICSRSSSRLHVALEHLAARPGPRAGERIGGVDQRRQDGLGLHLFVVRGDRVHDLRRLAVLARDLARRSMACEPSTSWVSALPMSCSSAARRACFSFRPSSPAIDAADERRLDRVHQHVLRVAVAVLQHADELDELGVDAVEPTSKIAFWPASRTVSSTSCSALRTTSSMRPGWMRPSEISRSSAMRAISRRIGLWHEITTALRRVVDDQVDAGRRLDGADVAALAADDAALHVVARQVDDRDRALGDELAGQPLDRDRDDLLRLAIRVLARLLLDLADPLRRFAARLLGHLLHEGSPGFLARQPGRLLELPAGGVDEGRDLGIAGLQPRFLRPARLFAACQLPLP